MSSKEYNKYANAVAILDENTVTVSCAYDNSSERLYTYKCDLSLAQLIRVMLEDNQKVFVVTEGSSSMFGVCQVVEVHDDAMINVNSDINYKWVIDVINRSIFDERKALERVNVEKLMKQQREAMKRKYLESLGVEDNVKLITELPKEG